MERSCQLVTNGDIRRVLAQDTGCVPCIDQHTSFGLALLGAVAHAEEKFDAHHNHGLVVFRGENELPYQRQVAVAKAQEVAKTQRNSPLIVVDSGWAVPVKGGELTFNKPKTEKDKNNVLAMLSSLAGYPIISRSGIAYVGVDGLIYPYDAELHVGTIREGISLVSQALDPHISAGLTLPAMIQSNIIRLPKNVPYTVYYAGETGKNNHPMFVGGGTVNNISYDQVNMVNLWAKAVGLPVI